MGGNGASFFLGQSFVKTLHACAQRSQSEAALGPETLRSRFSRDCVYNRMLLTDGCGTISQWMEKSSKTPMFFLINHQASQGKAHFFEGVRFQQPFLVA